MNHSQKIITKCDTVYYKLRQVLQSAMDLLQIATGITKFDDYYKLRQYNLTTDYPFSHACSFCLNLTLGRTRGGGVDGTPP